MATYHEPVHVLQERLIYVFKTTDSLESIARGKIERPLLANTAYDLPTFDD